MRDSIIALTLNGWGVGKPSHSKGFTLAEVLITLGIIGVVATMEVLHLMSAEKCIYLMLPQPAVKMVR